MDVKFDLSAFSASIDATKDRIQKATRPAAQAAAQVVYEAAVMLAPEGKQEHYFYGSASKAAPKGQKRARAYGPFRSGTLKAAIYQAFVEWKSGPSVATYHISFNREKAPYGHMVELGTSRAGAHAFLLPAMHDHGKAALDAMGAEFAKRVNA